MAIKLLSAWPAVWSPLSEFEHCMHHRTVSLKRFLCCFLGRACGINCPGRFCACCLENSTWFDRPLLCCWERGRGDYGSYCSSSWQSLLMDSLLRLKSWGTKWDIGAADVCCLWSWLVWICRGSSQLHLSISTEWWTALGAGRCVNCKVEPSCGCHYVLQYLSRKVMGILLSISISRPRL